MSHNHRRPLTCLGNSGASFQTSQGKSGALKRSAGIQSPPAKSSASQWTNSTNGQPRSLQHNGPGQPLHSLPVDGKEKPGATSPGDSHATVAQTKATVGGLYSK